MKLELATLIAGSETPAGDGITGAMRCVLERPDRSRCAAVLKRGSAGEVAAEAFSALLLRAWGLPVPEPFLIDEAGNISFASADAGYPNLKQHLGLAAIPDGPARHAAVLIASSLACGLATAPLAAACDEAIDNRDRNLGNVLWDGADEMWIDHAFALGVGAALQDRNQLCEMAVAVGRADKFGRDAIAHGLQLNTTVQDVVGQAFSSSRLAEAGFASFVAMRLSTIGNRLVARFPQTSSLLLTQ